MLTKPSSKRVQLGDLAGLRRAARELVLLRRGLDALQRAMESAVLDVPPERQESARNLVDYVALRSHDLRELQTDLARIGLSSLGRCESCVRRTLLQVSLRAHEALALAGDRKARHELDRIARDDAESLTWDDAKHTLHENTRAMFGPRPEDRHVYIMVTAPSAKEADRAWMTKMLRANMDVLRINCAHEGPEQWERMITTLKDAKRELGKECRVLMDLAGPKIRTGAIEDDRRVLTWKVAKDDFGAVTTPARILLTSAQPSEDTTQPVVLVNHRALRRLHAGDSLHFRDARGKKRALEIVEVKDGHAVAECAQRAYVLHGTRAQLRRAGSRLSQLDLAIPASHTAIRLRVGDELVLTSRAVPGRTSRRDKSGRLVRKGCVSCTLPEALELLQVGHRVLFDDGKIETVVLRAAKRRAEYVLRVVRTQGQEVKLGPEKGINLPDTDTRISAMTPEDIKALAFVAQHADAVSLSFVRRREDIQELYGHLDRLGRSDIGIVLKIETRSGFQNLPRILMEGLRRGPLAVMIARGDLAVEVGFERLAELQEEILWLCEAAHVPSIWATQVLDTLARTGVPSRAEVTDAAASVAAECVMLNKGPFVDQAVGVLSDILRRMEKHRYKKRSLYRKLQVSTFDER